MDEYIKREDALDAVLFALVGTGLQSTATYALRDIPTADVAPKSEVDFLRASQDLHEAKFNEIKAELELRNAEIETLKARLEVSKSEVAREIFEEIEKYSEVALMNGHIGTPILCIGHGTFAELKKKYESEKDNG